MSEYEKAARAVGFTIQTFGSVQKIARHNTDGAYVVSENGWRYACEDANIMTLEISINGKRMPVLSLKDAQSAWRTHVRDTGIGASGMKPHDGKVFDGKKKVATVSYNGRIWDNNGKEIIPS